MNCKKLFAIYTLLLVVVFSLTSSVSRETNAGIFKCYIDDKPLVIEGIHATMRTVTGGQRQLSLSNDRFSKFFLIMPCVKDIQLGLPGKKEAVVYYTDPSNLHQFYPLNGYIKIITLDETKKILTGEFEMELAPSQKEGKKIKVKQGLLINIPILYK